ncbi:MAG: thioredoxin family protein [Candidatus Nanopelagicales bacterium]
MTGLWVVAGVLIAATAFGIWNARASGRIRAASPASPAVPGIVPASPGDPEVDIVADPPDTRSAALVEALEGRLGPRATVVQFSTAFCQPCRATRRILEEVTAMVPGVTHVEIDAEDNLDLVRALDIRRTPTVMFLDGGGVLRKHASGLPRKADVIAAIGEIVPGDQVEPGEPSDFAI